VRVQGASGWRRSQSSSTSDLAGESSVRITSNHAVVAKRPQDLSWGPVIARDLSTAHMVALKFPRRLPFVGEELPITAIVANCTVQRESVRVVELVLDSGETAVWLQMAESSSVFIAPNCGLTWLPSNSAGIAPNCGFIATYGAFPPALNTAQRVVAIWGFSRAPRMFRQALYKSAELHQCRESLESAGFSFVLPSGGFMFVQPEEAELVQAALRQRNVAPRSSEVVVSPEFETRLEESLGLVPGDANVHRRRVNELRLDTAMGDILHFRNGRPFRYMVNGIWIQGRRTFIEIGKTDELRSMVTASTTDRHTAIRGGLNPRSLARSRLRRHSW